MIWELSADAKGKMLAFVAQALGRHGGGLPPATANPR
jgi:hypothetical protein